jgi:hypothetical protein
VEKLEWAGGLTYNGNCGFNVSQILAFDKKRGAE